VTYANANKVKSKARSIMNVKDNGARLEGYEEEFMKVIISYHSSHEEKMKDFFTFYCG
jgi:antitoxin component YwqK of YwqJK toxin-antitoxin module